MYNINTNFTANVTTVGGEILNLDGPLSREDAIKLASEIETEHNIDVKIVELSLVDLVKWMKTRLGNHIESSVSPWSDLTNYRDKYENGEVWRQLVHRKYWTGTVSIGNWSWSYSDREDSDHSEEEVAVVYKLFHVYHPLHRAN